MGLKYIEIVKSIVLLILVMLSFLFTFAIWTYTPRYETIEQLPTVDISIAKKQIIDEVIKPYKLLLNFDGNLKGTYDSTEIEYVMKELEKWEFSDLTLADNSFSAAKLDALMRKPNRLTLYFHGDVPLPIFDNVLNITDANIPETSFDRIVVDWNPAGISMDVIFISRKNNGYLYKVKAKVEDYRTFNRSVLTWGRGLGEYVEVDPDRSPFLAVPASSIEVIGNTYYEKEIVPSRFRDALFTDPNAVRLSQSGSNHEEYQDDHALMKVDTEKKTLNYVLPSAESSETAIPSEIFLNTLKFVNEHGGWTDEYRYMYMNPQKRYVKYQLFVHGLPVFGDTPGSTEITQVWGDNLVFRYMRPYYTLDLTLQTDVKFLKSGIEVIEMLRASETVDLDTVEEIIPGYFMKHDREQRLFIMEPSWFYLANGTWIRFSPELSGGEQVGLE
ncbi:YycH family regulatory protein [Sporosarcina limicola]|uniref:Regulatory protein YycH of two-component signal transduction system YycFG n=1 Tax=Sporosarcina limicola TaxID=34101 RepID=A0A927MPA0_9BACL|nr:two-component system activity regulator YycH [Sporosarcina limicola]MBE1556497.1 regulatory protein YycH of two-component signal transduction system YycFG [Sporosarcina limicola]